MNIRPATLDDSAALARVQVDSYHTAYAGILPQDYLDHFTYEEQEQDWRDLIGAGMDVLLVAEVEDGVIAGYAMGRSGPIIWERATLRRLGWLVAVHGHEFVHRGQRSRRISTTVQMGLSTGRT